MGGSAKNKDLYACQLLYRLADFTAKYQDFTRQKQGFEGSKRIIILTMSEHLNEIEITRSIFNGFVQKFQDSLVLDVAVVGAGPSGLVASCLLAEQGFKVAIFERKLAPGGGMWGGGMMFNEIAVQSEALELLKRFDIKYQQAGPDLFTADSVHATSMLLAKASSAGVRIFNLISVEDVMVRHQRITGLVIQWTPVEMTGLHVDPMTVQSKVVIDGTGHDAEVVKVVQDKFKVQLHTETGKIMDERPMWAQEAEKQVVQNTKEVYPGLWVIGMAANAVFGSPRMGPVFGGMLLSGQKAAVDIAKHLKQ